MSMQFEPDPDLEWMLQGDGRVCVFTPDDGRRDMPVLWWFVGLLALAAVYSYFTDRYG